MKQEETYYIVELICKYNDTNNFKIVDNVVRYCAEYESYPSIDASKSNAKRFTSPPDRDYIMSWDKHPWYYKITDFKIIEVNETAERQERYV